MPTRFHVLLILTGLLLVSPSYGWNDLGHETVAKIAWDALSPPQRDKAIEILEKLPTYHTDLEAAVPDGASKDQHDQIVFMRAATWPDMVRRDPKQAADNHPIWHGIGTPLIFDGTKPATTQPRNIDFNWDATRDADPQNIVQAIKKSEHDLQSSTDDAQRAKALCWTLHLVGDIHQPLHNVELFSSKHPTGDKNGNAIPVKGPPVAINLHAAWDDILGANKKTADNIDGAFKVAQQIESDQAYKPSEDQLKILSPDEWTVEGAQLARTAGYLNGKLEDNIDENRLTPLDKNYLANAKEIASHRVALAAARLAIVLSEALK